MWHLVPFLFATSNAHSEQRKAFLRCPRTNKMTGAEPRGNDTIYLHVRRTHARGATYTDFSRSTSLVDNGAASEPTHLPYDDVKELPPGLQGALDDLYDAQNSVAASMLHAIARGIGLNVRGSTTTVCHARVDTRK